MNRLASFLPTAEKFLEFVNASKTPFHAVETVKKILVANGFEKLNEKEVWSLKPNGKYFFTRNQSTIVPFCVGGQFVRKKILIFDYFFLFFKTKFFSSFSERKKAGEGFHFIGCHTDSPNLKVF